MQMRQIARMCVLVALVACPAWADIINGSFETGDFTGWWTQDIKGYAEVVDGGTDGLEVARLVLEGHYILWGEDWVFSSADVWLSQESIQVPSDAQYLLFDAWVEGYGFAIASLTSDHKVTVQSYVPVTYAIPVHDIVGTVKTLDFRGMDTEVGQNCVYLDNVRFTDIPEPGTMYLCASALLAAALRTGTRRRTLGDSV